MATLTTTLNYSGQLYVRGDNTTRFLDAIYTRGKGGGRRQTDSIEFVLMSGHDAEEATQPEISETQSLTAPDPDTTERDQEYNVTQIFHKSVKVSYLKQSNRGMLAGVNNQNQQNNVPNELDFQIGQRVIRMRKDLNYTMINGVYQYTKGSTTIASKTRGLLAGIQTNRIDMAGAKMSKEMFNETLSEAENNGADVSAFEIWCNPLMFTKIDDFAITLPGFNQPNTRTEGGVAMNQIMTHFGQLAVDYDRNIPTGMLLLVNMGEMAVAEMPYIDENGVNHGVLFYEPLAKTGAAESGQLFAAGLGCDYGWEGMHGIIDNIG